MKCIENDDSVT